MKKLALVLVISTVALSATKANIGTGFYAGGALGYGWASGNYRINQAPPTLPTFGFAEFGGNSGNIGIHGGYGWVDNSLYFGGELAYTFDNTRINNTINLGGTQFAPIGPNGGTSLKRNGYFNVAIRGGYLITPDTMLYIRLGSNLSKWTLRDAGNFAAPPFGSNFVGNGSVNRLSFVPGLGIETAFTKCVYLRGEYVYEFGPNVVATNPLIIGSNTSIRSIRSQSGKIGLSYRFLPGKDSSPSITPSNPDSRIGTGYYLGSAVGYGGLTGKYSQRGLSLAGNDVPGFGGSSGSSGNIGIHGGYGMVHNCVYAGGEVAYTFDNTQIKNTLIAPVTLQAGTQLKRHGYFNMAVRGGYLVTSATMLYLRLGANWSKWTFQDAGNSFSNFNQTLVGFGSKNRMTFVPGLGLETALNRHVYIRAEYTYEYCPTISAFNVGTDGYTSFSNLRHQSGKLGLSYKF